MTYTEINNKYFRLNRILLLAVGIWPYQQSNLTRFQFTFLSSILTTNVISQMKDILGQLFHVCNKLKDANEIAIINKYGCKAKRYTVALTILGVYSLSTFIVASFWSDIINIILSSNTSQPHHLLIVTEHFINQEKYFYLILLHDIASLCIGITAMLAIGTMFIAYLQHTCGMFKIASYRIEYAMNVNMLRNINHKKKKLILKSLIFAVDIHREAMKLSTLLLSNCQAMMFCLIIFGVGAVSLNLFRIFQIFSSSGINVKELIFPFIYASISLLYMFLSNYIGQNITNDNHHVFVTVYNVRWYIAPLHLQKIVLFLLQRNSRNFTLNVGGLFVASIECFATLVKTSVSYFTVIYSTR
ncbi:odorant receptor 9a-like isoform X2 [Polyergus mexicanus]|uniref:odorant receptor 9a-like isoform X2 n=1 Tax=Polyergus mexicanus TaxID=615972 RepID=UPI0038B665D5